MKLHKQSLLTLVKLMSLALLTLLLKARFKIREHKNTSFKYLLVFLIIFPFGLIINHIQSSQNQAKIRIYPYLYKHLEITYNVHERKNKE